MGHCIVIAIKKLIAKFEWKYGCINGTEMESTIHWEHWWSQVKFKCIVTKKLKIECRV